MTRSALQDIDPESAALIEEALGSWQRRRAFQYCLVAAGFFLLAGIQMAVDLIRQGTVTLSNWIDIGVISVYVLGYVAAGLQFRRMPPIPRRVARLFGWIMVAAGAAGIIASFMILAYDSESQPEVPDPATQAFVSAGTALVIVFLVHFVGSLFVALPPRAALWPLLPLWTLYAGGVMLMEGPPWFRVVLAACFPLAGGPGLLWSVWRHERTVQGLLIKVLGGPYGAIRRDLSEARRLHQAIFPEPIREGPIRLDFEYEPMRDVGGDFIFIRRIGADRLLVVLVDVTGHGIASALAVTRIHAALALLASGEEASKPAALVRRLNGFVHQEFAQQGIYATAIVLLVDVAAGRLRWCSAGHPSGLLRRRTGSGEAAVSELGATSMMLGVVPEAEYPCEDSETSIAAGDLVVLCTDGLLEAAGPGGQPFGEQRLRSIVLGGAAGVAKDLLRSLGAFRVGAAADDTLIVEIPIVEGGIVVSGAAQ